MLAAPAGHGAHPMGYCNFVSRDEINKMHISLSFFICVFRYTGTPAFFVTFRVKQIGTPGGTWFSSHLCCATMVVGFVFKHFFKHDGGTLG
jgi:hypothetical protein